MNESRAIKEVFSDRGLYLGVCGGMTPSKGFFLFDETTGKISANPDHTGVCNADIDGTRGHAAAKVHSHIQRRRP